MAQHGPLSLNELQFYVTRAVVGAGAPFGIAEEVARAIVALAAAGEDPTARLIRALIALGDGEASSKVHLERREAPDTDSLSSADDAPLSALFAGPFAGDWVKAYAEDADWQITPDGDLLHIRAGDARLNIGPVDVPELAQSIALQIIEPAPPEPPEEGVMVDAESWAIIEQYFRRCLVPSSEESRLSGAGAGLIEED